MSKKGKGDSYVYIDTETIKKACGGNRDAQSRVIQRYLNYARKCFRTIAATNYSLDMRSVPMEDLMQHVWMRFIAVIEKRFKV